MALYPHFPQLLSDFDEIWYKRSAHNAVGNHRKTGRPFLMHTHTCIVKHYDMSKVKNACVLRHALRHLLLSRLPATSAPLGPHRTASGLHRQLYDDGRQLCYVLINELQNFLMNGTRHDSRTLSALRSLPKLKLLLLGKAHDVGTATNFVSTIKCAV